MNKNIGVRCNACDNIFVMAPVMAWDGHPEMAHGAIIQPLCCPYCGEVESFSLRSHTDSIIDAVIGFANEERNDNAKPESNP